jgi:shikimate dehydrogenase
MGRTLLGVAGFPVSHSRSPAMQNAALSELGLDWLYVPVPVPPELFEETTRALGPAGFRGLNVTVPHKLAAHDLADSRSPAAKAIGAVNTLTFEGGGIGADNTDAAGLLDAIGESPAGRTALVLGAGGAARAAVWALRDAGAAEVSVWNRTAERAAAVASDLGARPVARPEAADLVVNCTAVGLGGGEIGDLALEGVEPGSVVVDMVYGEGVTPVQEWAQRGGARFVGGVEVLARQGARSLERWTGRPPPVEVMRAAAGAELDS